MNTSYKVIELVKQRIGTEYLKASDADAAKVLGISRTSVSNYKGGRDLMSQETLLKAQEIIQLKTADLITLALDLQIEGTKHEGSRSILKAMRDLAAMYATKAASVLLVGTMAAGGVPDGRASVNSAHSHQHPAGSTSGQCILC